MQPTLGREPFDSSDWIYELKLGGVRALAAVTGETLRLQGSNLADLLPLYPEFSALPGQLLAKEALLDGEIVAWDDAGQPQIERLRTRLGSTAPPARLLPGHRLSYVVYDLLWLDGRSLLDLPLWERRNLLHGVLRPSPRVQACDFVETTGHAFYTAVAERGLEGIVAKNKYSRYEPGRRSRQWLELPVLRSSAFVIGGYTFGGRRREPFHALLLGACPAEASSANQSVGASFPGGTPLTSSGPAPLVYVGQVSGPFAGDEARQMLELLMPRHTERCPFVAPPSIQRFIHWCRPEVVCQVRYSAVTPEGILRFPVFAALRPDLSPADCPAPEPPRRPEQLRRHRPGLRALRP